MAIIKSITPVQINHQLPDPDILQHLQKMDLKRATKASAVFIKAESKFSIPKKQAI
jgi:hypothetical protein